MYVVGTAGHIDHGKTLLISALTGIDCDRLPEEKEREMTIDLGFAHMELPGFGTVGFIDVPGHERFIRNMVAGAWGMDLGLLVVAADDGWMQQSEDHLRVLRLLSVPRIIAVINKIDIADAGNVAAIAAVLREKLNSAGFGDADIMKVSAKRGDGIGELKKAIERNCALLPRPEDQDRPYIYVDRVFAVKGHGTVVTGTQKNGIFSDNDAVTVLPSGKEVRIKKMESHKHAAPRETSIRAALNLAGIASEDASRGSIVVKKNFLTRTDDFIASVILNRSEGDEKKDPGIEVLVGTADIPGRMAGLIHDGGARGNSIARIRLERHGYLFPGQRFVLTKTGGYRIFGGGTVLIPSYEKETMRVAVRERAASLAGLSMTDIIRFNIAVRGKLRMDEARGKLPLKETRTDDIISALTSEGFITKIGDFAVLSERALLWRKALSGAIEAAQGRHLKELADTAGIDPELCAVMARELTEKGTVEERDGRFFLKGAGAEESLSREDKAVLAKAEKAGPDGLSLDTAPVKEKNSLKDLIGRGFLVSLDGKLLWHKKLYEDMKRRIMDLFTSREKISIGDARDATGLSRKYLIPLLNRIERDGALKRVGDFRIKAR